MWYKKLWCQAQVSSEVPTYLTDAENRYSKEKLSAKRAKRCGTKYFYGSFKSIRFCQSGKTVFAASLDSPSWSGSYRRELVHYKQRLHFVYHGAYLGHLHDGFIVVQITTHDVGPWVHSPYFGNHHVICSVKYILQHEVLIGCDVKQKLSPIQLQNTDQQRISQTTFYHDEVWWSLGISCTACGYKTLLVQSEWTALQSALLSGSNNYLQAAAERAPRATP